MMIARHIDWRVFYYFHRVEQSHRAFQSRSRSAKLK
jgi:hypothetical protein